MKFPLFIIIASQLSDVQELVQVGGDKAEINLRLNFVKWLLNKQLLLQGDRVAFDTDAQAEWEEFANTQSEVTS